MRIKTFLLFLFLSTGALSGQANFLPGYVIKTNGDTLAGSIDYRNDMRMGRVCRFRQNDSEKADEYSPDDIEGYRFEKGKYFVSREVNGNKVFVEFLIKGVISIYYLSDNKGDHYYLEKGGSGLVEIPYDEGIRYRDGIPYSFQTTGHIPILNNYMQDVPGMESRISKMDKIEQRELISLAKDYHHQVCDDWSCIVYEKKMPFFKFTFEISGGIINYQTIYDIQRVLDPYDIRYGLKDINYFNTGILVHIWSPWINDNIYFKTGVYFSTLEDFNTTINTYKFPVHIEYIYPKGIIRPAVSLGVNAFNTGFVSPSVNAGLNIKLGRYFSWSCSYGIDFNMSELSGESPGILSNSFSTGIIINN